MLRIHHGLLVQRVELALELLVLLFPVDFARDLRAELVDDVVDVPVLAMPRRVDREGDDAARGPRANARGDRAPRDRFRDEASLEVVARRH